MAANSATRPLTTSQGGWLLVAAVAAAAPHAMRSPPWLTAVAAALLSWRAWLLWRGRPLPSRPWLLAGATTAAAAVFFEYRTLLGQNPGIALLLLFLALKLLEARTVRDALAAVFLAYFLTMAQFFSTQSIPVAALATLSVIAATAALAALVDEHQPPAAHLGLAGRLLLNALPLMLVAFVLFPRVQGPLWGLPKDAHSGTTGLSDSMAPGSISELIQSDEVAFRALFADAPPPPARRYWRGPVLTSFDGRTWRPLPDRPAAHLPYTVPPAATAEYEITLEPSGKPWLLALELPAGLPAEVYVRRDYQLLARAPITERSRYRLRAFFDAEVGGDEGESALRAALSLPPDSNPRTRALGQGWRASGGDDEEVLRQAITFFRNQQLTYTLLPPALGRDTADEFLFDTKAGFCEHFAGAFAVAMRAAGIPTRVVTGYLGGEVNGVDGYLVVRQSDAHAWTEVWLRGRGWQRIDPTAISAPRRVDANVAAAVPAGDPLPLWLRLHAAWLHDLRMRWDAVANTWNQWVLGYDGERQRDFLRRLGMPTPDWQSMAVALTAASAAVMAVIAILALRRSRRDRLQRLWLRVCKRLAKAGLPRLDWEGPQSYAERVAQVRPDLARAMLRLAGHYAALRYGRGTPDDLDRLRRAVAAFKP